MANAIPVTQDPQESRKVKIEVPKVDQNGVQLPADYVATVRENLGHPADFRSGKVTTFIPMNGKGEPLAPVTREDF